MKKTRILMVGAGRMAEAILSGLVTTDHPSLEKITMTNKSDKSKLTYIKDKYNVSISQKWEDEVKNHDVILLASPPHTHEDLLHKLNERMSNQLVVTVAAGIDPSYMEKRLPKGAPVCWIMPNTAAQVGKSMSTYVCGKHVQREHREVISLILSSIGEAGELTEQQVHDLTAITGSAPAFVYAFVEALEDAAVENGVTRDQARQLVKTMLNGSVAMIEAGHEPKDLCEQVASPGGSTAEGLKVLEKKGFHDLVKEAVRATNEHARSQGEK
ncbi:pyrroline-5-carboxylate reductase [Bacillus shivajii]|uniref:pyrroline-5-carboxylate reductase n=1 Tax=Bacillus shivajii TaxID=1983719 RepID=UPI001CFB2D95|nr:pyrroline-5-carboxylate reductase [Bacillus shivajii]UCZ52353.1 pyrroline-5-carboxylate reductase [Bacillus shivajii]